MYVIEPMIVNDTTFTSSNIPENDYAAWNSGTAYVVGNRVIVISTHSVYQAVANNTNQDPTLTTNIYNATTNPTGEWLRVSATNRWKAFDQRIADTVVGGPTIEYSLTTSSVVTAISFFNLSATSITITVTNTSATVIYNQTFDLADTSTIVDWYSFFTYDTGLMTELTVTDLPAYASYIIGITITGSQVGQIVPGKLLRLGYTNEDTVVGFDDFSTKARDETFGYVTVVERGFSDYIDFRFSIEYADLGYVERVIKRLRATPAVWLADPAITNLSSTVYGFQSGEFRASLKSTGLHSAALEIEGLI
jgi:hypothetical protein